MFTQKKMTNRAFPIVVRSIFDHDRLMSGTVHERDQNCLQKQILIVTSDGR